MADVVRLGMGRVALVHVSSTACLGRPFFRHNNIRNRTCGQRWRGYTRNPLPVQQRGLASSCSPASSSPWACSAGCVIQQFISAFNSRDLEGMVLLLSDNVLYHNLGYPQPYQGKPQVRGVLQALLAATPTDWELVVEDTTGPSAGGQQGCMAVTWRMVSQGRALPLLSGLSFYRLDDGGQIAYIKEAAEQLVKVPAPLFPLIGGAAPLLQLLAGPASAPAPRSPAGVGGSRGGQTGKSPQRATPQRAAGPAKRNVVTSATGSAAAQNPDDPAAGSSVGRGFGDRATSGSSSSSSNNSSSSSSSSSVGGQPGAPRPGWGGRSSGLGGLEGVWLKDLKASDMASYDRALQLMQIGGLQRTTAVQLLEGIQLEQTGAQVALKFLTVVPFFSISEGYNLSQPTRMQRRDLKSGTQQAQARLSEAGELVVDISWQAPNPGSLQEVYRPSPSGELEVIATLKVQGGSETTRQVYRRAERWTPKFKWPGVGLWGSGR